MIGLLQRVTSASVTVGDETIGAIGAGLLVLCCVRPDDTEKSVRRLAERLLGYRVFADDDGRMNLSVTDVAGGVLLVPQFTLAADTKKGTRASFTKAADPRTGRHYFELLVAETRLRHAPVETGRFGADMKVALVNDGPVTFWLES
jgi:D-tyrosyl-tRNA(Tyr) deacylase